MVNSGRKKQATPPTHKQAAAVNYPQNAEYRIHFRRAVMFADKYMTCRPKPPLLHEWPIEEIYTVPATGADREYVYVYLDIDSRVGYQCHQHLPW